MGYPVSEWFPFVLLSPIGMSSGSFLKQSLTVYISFCLKVLALILFHVPQGGIADPVNIQPGVIILHPQNIVVWPLAHGHECEQRLYHHRLSTVLARGIDTVGKTHAECPQTEGPPTGA